MILDSNKILNNSLKYINNFIYNNVFNQPAAEFRTNIKLLKLSNRTKRGTYIDTYRCFDLPSGDTGYYVFICSIQSLFGLIPLSSNWIRTDTLNNEYGTCLDVYNEKGIMLPKASVYVHILNKMKREVIFAISSEILTKIVGNMNDANIYLTMSNPILVTDRKRTILSHVPGINSKYIEIKNKLLGSNTMNLEVYINGFNYDRTKAINFFTNNTLCYDLYIDENVKDEISIDPSTRKAYLSINDNLYKDIIHIPKSNNPDNEIFTYNEMRIFIRNSDGKGLFISYIAEESISQLTFNDISIPSFIIDSVLDFLNDPDYVIFIKLLKYDPTPIYFVKGGSCVEKMYKYETDANIIKHFNKELSQYLDVWSGNSLEVSPHIQALYNYNYNDKDINQISDHIKVLGYYYYMSLICPQIYEFTGISTLDTINITKPIVFKDIDLFGIVYLNGKKIEEECITTLNRDMNLSISFSNVVILKTDIIHVRIFPDFSNNIYVFTPTAVNNKLIIKKDEFDVYIKFISSSIDINTPFGHINEGYRLITENNFYTITDNGDDTLKLEFSSVGFGFTFYISPKYFSSYKRITENNLTEQRNLIYDIEIDTAYGAVKVLEIGEIEVYLNGYYLIKGLDYKLVKLETISTGTVSGYQLVIQNMNYLKTNNSIDIYISSTKIENQKTDFSINNKIMNDNLEEIWQNGLSYFIADGKIIPNNKIIKEGFNFSFVDEIPNGTPCTIKTMLPAKIKEIFSPYEDESYFYNLAYISDYLFGDLVVNNPDIIVAVAYKVFSPYLNEIIRKIIADEITITANDSIEDLLLKLTPFDYLKKFDLIFSGEENDIDLRFVDMYPSYLTRIQTKDFKYVAIRNLINYYLGSDFIHNTEIVYS